MFLLKKQTFSWALGRAEWVRPVWIQNNLGFHLAFSFGDKGSRVCTAARLGVSFNFSVRLCQLLSPSAPSHQFPCLLLLFIDNVKVTELGNKFDSLGFDLVLACL